jgi:hypothetical protein
LLLNHNHNQSIMPDQNASLCPLPLLLDVATPRNLRKIIHPFLCGQVSLLGLDMATILHRGVLKASLTQPA